VILGEIVVWASPALALAVGLWGLVIRRWPLLAMALAAAGATFLGAALLFDACVDSGCDYGGQWALLISWPLSIALLIGWAVVMTVTRVSPRSDQVP
jgi:hypothetical protein